MIEETPTNCHGSIAGTPMANHWPHPVPPSVATISRASLRASGGIKIRVSFHSDVTGRGLASYTIECVFTSTTFKASPPVSGPVIMRRPRFRSASRRKGPSRMVPVFAS